MIRSVAIVALLLFFASCSFGQERKPWCKDRKHFWIPFAAIILSTGFDVETTKYALKTCPTCYESNPIVGSSRWQEYGVNLPFDFIVAFGIHRIRNEGADWLQVPVEGAHIAAGISNLRQ